MPRESPALLVVSGKGRDSWLLSALLNAVLDHAEQDVFVEWAGSLTKALERLRERSWQACLVDEQVGDETGLEVVRRARAAGIGVPMVLCVAHEDKTLEDIALEEGAAEVIPLASTSARQLARLLHAAMVRGRAESRLRSTGDRHVRLFEESPVAMSVSTLEDGRFVEANAAFCRLIGYAREEVIGHTSQELGLWVEERGRTAMRARLKQSGIVDGMETVLQDRQGRLLHVLTTARTVRLDGKPCVLSVSIDITGQRRAESELQRRDAQLDAAEAQAGSGSWDYDVPTASMRFSANLERLLGLAEAPRSLEGYLQRVAPEDRERVAEAFRRSTERGAPLKVRHLVRDAEGKLVEMEMRGMPEFDVQDEPISISGTVHPTGGRPRRGVANHPPEPAGRAEVPGPVQGQKSK